MTLWEARRRIFTGSFFCGLLALTGRRNFWAAPLAEIARAETGMTKQWIGSRTLGQTVHPVTDFPGQAFLFMNDGSRRVFCSVNANHEATATLAHSVHLRRGPNEGFRAASV